MKRTSINVWLGLLAWFMAAPAFPLSYEIDVGGDGSFETGEVVNLSTQSPATVDFYLDDYSCPPDDLIFSARAYVLLDESIIQVNSCSPYDTEHGGPFDPALSGCTNLEQNVYFIAAANYSFVQVSDGQQKFGTMEIEVLQNDVYADLVTATDLTSYGYPAYDDCFISDCNLTTQYPSDGIVTISSQPPPCACDISGPATIQASAFNHVTAIYVSSQVAFTDCDNPPVYAYSDTCILGDINPNTGLLTVPATMVGELCEVCSTDTANTAVTVECCQNIRIVPGDT